MCRFHQIRGQVGEGSDTRSGGEFQREIPRERRYREGTSEPRRKKNKKQKTQDTWVDAVENEEVAKIKRAVFAKDDSIVLLNYQGVQHQREQPAAS